MSAYDVAIAATYVVQAVGLIGIPAALLALVRSRQW